MQSKVYSDENATEGFTAADYAECPPESVPNIVRAFYNYQHPDDEADSVSSGGILEWWAKNRPTFYHGSASVPLVLGDSIVDPDSKCLASAVARKQPPEADAKLLGNFDFKNGECSIRESCCPGADPKAVPTSTCEQLCTTEMNPLERYKIRLGVDPWTDIIRACKTATDSNAFCRFAGQYSMDSDVWSAGTPYALFSADAFGKPGSRLCVGQSASDSGAIRLAEASGSRPARVVFVTTGPRTEMNVLWVFGFPFPGARLG